MGDEHEAGGEVSLHAHQLELRFFAQLAVERGKGLIEQQQARPAGERTRQRHPLALATRKLIRLAGAKPFKLHELQQFLDTRGDLRPGQARLHKTKAHIARHAHMRKQRIGLEHHVHRPAMRLDLRHILAIDENAPLVGRLEPGDESHERGLAAARRAEQRKELTCGDFQRHRINSRHRAIALGDAVERDQGGVGHGRFNPRRARPAQCALRAHAAEGSRDRLGSCP